MLHGAVSGGMRRKAVRPANISSRQYLCWLGARDARRRMCPSVLVECGRSSAELWCSVPVLYITMGTGSF